MNGENYCSLPAKGGWDCPRLVELRGVMKGVTEFRRILRHDFGIGLDKDAVFVLEVFGNLKRQLDAANVILDEEAAEPCWWSIKPSNDCLCRPCRAKRLRKSSLDASPGRETVSEAANRIAHQGAHEEKS